MTDQELLVQKVARGLYDERVRTLGYCGEIGEKVAAEMGGWDSLSDDTRKEWLETARKVVAS